MYARSTTVQAQVGSIDAGISNVRDEVMPALQRMDGCIGLSMLVNRDTGRCIVTSAWQSEEAMRTSAGLVGPLRDRASELLGGTPSVESWEIALLHRHTQAPDGACVRATWMQVEPARIAAALDSYRHTTIPGMEDLDGFCSASLLVDRSSGRAVSSATFESRAAMSRSRDKGAALRASSAKQSGATLVDVAEFDLALAHLRVPEMA